MASYLGLYPGTTRSVQYAPRPRADPSSDGFGSQRDYTSSRPRPRDVLRLEVDQDGCKRGDDTMGNCRSLPSFEESCERLRCSRWRLSQHGHPLIGDGLEYMVDGRDGENQIHVTGATLFDAWHRAVEQAAACGMLAGLPRPATGMR